MQDEAITNAPMQPNAARGDFVVRRGMFFQVGEYPDKQFGLTEAEADTAIAGFVPVPLNVEHIPTIFDGKLGFVQRLWREGRNILAEYSIPRWLQDVTQNEPIKISSEWNRANKEPIGGAFVLHPRVADAVMQAAFAACPHPRPLSQKSLGEGSLYYEAFANVGGRNRRSHDEHLRGVAFAVSVEDKNENGTGEIVRKELGSMTLLAGLRALFARAGVPSDEIDAHLLTPELEGANTMGAGGLTSAFGSNTEAGTVVLNSAVGGGAETGNALGMVASGVSAADEDAARFAAMEAELNRLRRQAQEAEQAARFTVDTRLIDGWVRAFQMTPVEAEAWRLIAQATPAVFAAAIPALNMRPCLPQLAGGATVKASETADVGRLEALTQQKMKESGLDHTAAFKRVCGENRELAQSVRARSQEGN